MTEPTPKAPLTQEDVLRGKCVYLRPPRLDELPFIRSLWADPKTMAAVGGTVDWPLARARKWFAHMVHPGTSDNCYCLIFNEKGTPVGEISFHRWQPEEKTAELNVKILAPHRRRGYARDALGVFLGYFFGQFGGEVMIDDVALDNRAGRHLMAALGFRHDAERTDVYRMRMTKRMFTALHGKPGKCVGRKGKR